MKAAVLHAPHDLRIEEVEVPSLGDHDVMVRIRAGGICGSDLHYYHHGGFGAVRLREPMILGHEIAGEVVEVGKEVTAVMPGTKVAVNPSQPCGQCRFCREGMANQCLDMRFYGSAMRMPHMQGGFREILVCHEAQAIPVPSGTSLELAAFAEPLSVCLHAARQAGSLLGKRVLVTGTGPIGALSVLVARHAGAREVVATDLAEAPLRIAKRLGADDALNLRQDPDALGRFAADKGYFDVVFEASGAAAAITSALQATRPGGTMVQLGLAGSDLCVPLNLLVAKEITWRGTFRFHEEFVLAVNLIGSSVIDVSPLLTDVLPLADAQRAFEKASDREHAMKVQIAF